MTTLLNKINKDLIQAMKDKDATKKGLLQLVKAGVINAQLETTKEFDDNDVIKIIQREIKQQMQSLEAFEKAERDDLISETAKKIFFLKAYLPIQLSALEIKNILIENGVKQDMNMGEAMTIARKSIEQGTADNKLVSTVVKEIIQ